MFNVAGKQVHSVLVEDGDGDNVTITERAKPSGNNCAIIRKRTIAITSLPTVVNNYKLWHIDVIFKDKEGK